MSKETKYQCFFCGKLLDYKQLRKRLTHTTYTLDKKIESHYNHSCPVCNGKKFIVLLIVKEFSIIPIIKS